MDKKCTKCGVAKPATAEYFPIAKTCKSGLAGSCRACAIATTKKWRAENKDKVSEQSARTYRRKRDRLGLPPRPKAVQLTPEQRRAKVNARYKERREEILAQTRARRNNQRYKESRTIRSANRRARIKFGIDEKITVADWHAVLEAAGHRCVSCYSPQKLTIDHIVPMSIGGPNRRDNIQPLCLSCNGRKGKKVIDYRAQVRDMCPL